MNRVVWGVRWDDEGRREARIRVCAGGDAGVGGLACLGTGDRTAVGDRESEVCLLGLA